MEYLDDVLADALVEIGDTDVPTCWISYNRGRHDLVMELKNEGFDLVQKEPRVPARPRLKVINQERMGELFQPGDLVQNFRGETGILVEATRATTADHDGLILVRWSDTDRPVEYYGRVFGLTVVRDQ